ncbi:MAG: hypothetical protein ACFFCZ_12225 [Promethearchaeota archaeon]
MSEESVIKLLTQAVVMLTEKNQEIVNLLREMNNRLETLDNYLRSATNSSRENRNLYELEMKENAFHPLLQLNLPEPRKKTLTILTELYQEKKRPISIKEIEDRINQKTKGKERNDKPKDNWIKGKGYEGIYADLNKLQEEMWVDEPVTKRSLKQELNLIEIQGNPENIDLNLPEKSHGRALFWKPSKRYLDFRESRKAIENTEE